MRISTPTPPLKLKQASAVLRVPPKELQNLAQFGVVKPRKSNGTYVFDAELLLAAKIALTLKACLGANRKVLTKFARAFQVFGEQRGGVYPESFVFKCALSGSVEPIRLEIPLRSLADQIQNDMGRADLYRDLPRGRKRPGWKDEFLAAISEAAVDMGGVSEAEILSSVRASRRSRSAPEITIEQGR